MERLYQSITHWLLSTVSEYQYVILNGISDDKPVAAFYSVLEDVRATPIFAGTRFSGDSEIGPWLIQLMEINMPLSLKKSKDWGFFLVSSLPFEKLVNHLKHHLEASIGSEKFLVRWWDPRVVFYLLQDFTSENSFLSCAKLFCIPYDNNYYQFEGSNQKKILESQEQRVWQLKNSDFNSYRQSEYYALQLASSISERWLRFDADQWRQLTLKHGSLEKKLTPFIHILYNKGVTDADKLEDFMLRIIKQSITVDQILDKQTDNIDSWLKKLERQVHYE
ncbi:DUF4123 domain-containing protein [Spartinivicinus ruber]|uniref:DUF4123 domain-containing protein n=1 Tax=Spartinivicinus ruber TaxID=2683272 RepID=UPI0013D1A340|nr:DUF4123 domain-containing protein [Spartinivicinus ruber]